MVTVSLAVLFPNSETFRDSARGTLFFPNPLKKKGLGAHAGTFFRRQLLDQLGKRFLGPTSGRRGHNSKRKKRFQKGNKFGNNDFEREEVILPLRGTNFCRKEFPGIPDL